MPTGWLLPVAYRRPAPTVSDGVGIDLFADRDSPFSAPREWHAEILDEYGATS